MVYLLFLCKYDAYLVLVIVIKPTVQWSPIKCRGVDAV